MMMMIMLMIMKMIVMVMMTIIVMETVISMVIIPFSASVISSIDALMVPIHVVFI